MHDSIQVANIADLVSTSLLNFCLVTVKTCCQKVCGIFRPECQDIHFHVKTDLHFNQCVNISVKNVLIVFQSIIEACYNNVETKISS